VVLGRASGLTDEEMSHLLDDPLPEGMFSPAEEAIIGFARASTWMQPITDEIYKKMAEHFDTKQIMEISFTVGLDQLISRFHATVRTDLDEVTSEATNACAVRIPDAPEV
jgi:alkylhydroperoxidase family enzyme